MARRCPGRQADGHRLQSGSRSTTTASARHRGCPEGPAVQPADRPCQRPHPTL